MESLLWALDLMAVVYLSVWALKQEKLDAETRKKKASDNA
jgi:hypothetical protein